MNTHICPTCGKLHIATKKDAPWGICGACGEALPSPTVTAHLCAATPMPTETVKP